LAERWSVVESPPCQASDLISAFQPVLRYALHRSETASSRRHPRRIDDVCSSSTSTFLSSPEGLKAEEVKLSTAEDKRYWYTTRSPFPLPSMRQSSESSARRRQPNQQRPSHRLPARASMANNVILLCSDDITPIFIRIGEDSRGNCDRSLVLLSSMVLFICSATIGASYACSRGTVEFELAVRRWSKNG